MAINWQLAEDLGLSEEVIFKIEEIHEELGCLLEACDEGYRPEYFDYIEQLEFLLQGLWGFEQNEERHTWKHLYKFRCQWVGRKFRCLTTGEELVIPDKVYPRDYLSFGEAGVDVGVLDGYYRMNNCEEIKGEGNV